MVKYYAKNTENMSENHQAYRTAMFPCIQKLYDSRLFSSHFIVGGDSLEGQLLNSRVPKWDLSMQVFTCVLSLQRKLLIDVFCIYLLVLLERLDSGDSEWHLGWWTTYKW